MKKYLIILLSVVAIVACNKNQGQNGGNSVADVVYGFREDDSVKALSESQFQMLYESQDFAFNLSKRIYDKEHKSYVMSPLSMTYLMGMLSAGAASDTREEMLKVMGYEGKSQEEFDAFCHDMLALSKNRKDGVDLSLANIIVADYGFPVLDSYKQTIGANYDAAALNRDFKSPETLDYVNSWVESKTNEMIKDFFDHLPETGCVLVNAMYFNGKWSGFEESDTRKATFTDITEQKSQVDMMHQLAQCRYCETDSYKAVVLPYEDPSYSMTVVLPDEHATLRGLVSSMTSAKWNAMKAGMEICQVSIDLPKFDIDYKDPSLASILKDMGLQSAFGPNPDYSNITDKDVNVNQVIHAAKIMVSEKGTEGAAASGAGMDFVLPSENDNPDKIFNANHPFMFAVTDDTTGALIFLGCYM